MSNGTFNLRVYSSAFIILYLALLGIVLFTTFYHLNIFIIIIIRMKIKLNHIESLRYK